MVLEQTLTRSIGDMHFSVYLVFDSNFDLSHLASLKGTHEKKV